VEKRFPSINQVGFHDHARSVYSSLQHADETDEVECSKARNGVHAGIAVIS